MTRINLVPPSELMDQHLFAEWREIKMVPKSLRRSIQARGVEGVLQMVPPAYVLGKGHVSFFYDKAVYLAKRYWALTQELHNRGVNFDTSALLDTSDVYTVANLSTGLDNRFRKDYTPTPEALALIRARIAEKIALKPDWYRYSSRYE